MLLGWIVHPRSASPTIREKLLCFVSSSDTTDKIGASCTLSLFAGLHARIILDCKFLFFRGIKIRDARDAGWMDIAGNAGEREDIVIERHEKLGICGGGSREGSSRPHHTNTIPDPRLSQTKSKFHPIKHSNFLNGKP